MNRIDRLLKSYARFIAVPWRDDASSAQRVIFCVYNAENELQLRAKIGEFEIATKQARHEWAVFDLTNTFADWFAIQRYKESYFEKPQLIHTILHKYLDYLREQFEKFLLNRGIVANGVVALEGVGSLFGFLKVKEVIDMFAPLVKGRLVVFFPGTLENDNYRLLDAYDGWNYLAVPITADQEL